MNNNPPPLPIPAPTNAPPPSTVVNVSPSPAPIAPPPSAPPDTSALEHASALSPFASPVAVVAMICTVGAFVALFAGKCAWTDMQTFVPIIFGVLGGTTAITEAARRMALGKVLSK